MAMGEMAAKMGAAGGVTEKYIEARFSNLSDAVAGLANSIKRLDAHMETLVALVGQQQEQARRIGEMSSQMNALESRTRTNELAIASATGTRSGSLAVLQWLTGGSFLAVVTLIWLMTRGGA